MITIDEAEKSDIPALCGLLNELFVQEIEFTPDCEAQKCGLESIIGNRETGRILVMRDNGLVVGMANLLFTVSTALGARVALLEDVVITRERRREGLGGILMKHVKRYAAENGCRRITLLTDQDNAIATKLYESYGFKKSSMKVMRYFN
jgi:GNAT superfamily N-acetyltransferase